MKRRKDNLRLFFCRLPATDGMNPTNSKLLNGLAIEKIKLKKYNL
jgi:hypothetical protein